MMKNKYDRIIDQFAQYYPNLYEQAIDWWASGRASITVKVDNATAVEYDSLDNSIRYIRLSHSETTPEELKSAFGSNLQKMLPLSGMTQAEFADKIGISNVMMSKYIHGKSMPSADKAYQIARVVGCRIDDLFDQMYSD